MRAQSLGGSPSFRVSIFLGPAGGPRALGVPTAALGAEAPVAEAYAAGFLPPVWDADADIETSVQLIRGCFKSSRLCVLF